VESVEERDAIQLPRHERGNVSRWFPWLEGRQRRCPRSLCSARATALRARCEGSVGRAVVKKKKKQCTLVDVRALIGSCPLASVWARSRHARRRGAAAQVPPRPPRAPPRRHPSLNKPSTSPNVAASKKYESSIRRTGPAIDAGATAARVSRRMVGGGGRHASCNKIGNRGRRGGGRSAAHANCEAASARQLTPRRPCGRRRPCSRRGRAQRLPSPQSLPTRWRQAAACAAWP